MVTENTVTDLASSSEESENTQVDWQARAETAEANEKKLTNDLKSQQGRQSQNQAINEIVDRVGGIEARFTALVKRTASGETEALTGDMVAIDQKTAADKADAEWENAVEEATQSLRDVLLDDEGELLVSSEVRERLGEAWKEAKDVNGLYRVVGQAGREARKAVKEKVTEEAEGAKKVSDAKHGNHDLSVGNKTGIGGGKSITQIASATNVNDISDEDYDKWLESGG